MAWREPGAPVAARASVFRCETGKARTSEGFAGECGTVGFETSEARAVERFGALLNLLGKGLRGDKRFAAFRFGAGEEFGRLAYVASGADLNHPAASRHRRAADVGTFHDTALRRLFYRGLDFIGARGSRGDRASAYRGRGRGREIAAES